MENSWGVGKSVGVPPLSLWVQRSSKEKAELCLQCGRGSGGFEPAGLSC